ncbi:MAG: hypothetical protein F4Y26_01730 [Gammaproteobacteria bacterium]|nr:hypothetical protein [Gammaproteobacteria bacterium]
MAVGADEGVGPLVEIRGQAIGTCRLPLLLLAATGGGHWMFGQQDRIDDLEDALAQQQVLCELRPACEQRPHGAPAMAEEVAAAGLLLLEGRRDLRHQQICDLGREETLYHGDAVVPNLRRDACGRVIGPESADRWRQSLRTGRLVHAYSAPSTAITWALM